MGSEDGNESARRGSVPADRQCGARARVEIVPGHSREITCTLDRDHELDHGAGVPVGRWGREQVIAWTWQGGTHHGEAPYATLLDSAQDQS